MTRLGGRQGSAVRKAAEKTADFIRKAGDFLLPPDLFAPQLAPAYAGSRRPVSAPQREFVFEAPRKGSNAALFDSGDAPAAGSASRKLMEWTHGIEVLEPGEARDPKKFQMDYDEAQRAVSAIVKEPRAVHSYLALEAARMFSSETLVRKHTWHLVVGALAEDYTFMPGESLKDISTNQARVPEALDFVLRHGSIERPSFMRGMLLAVSRLWNRFKRDPYGNAADRPYWAHFFRRTSPLQGEGLTLFNGDLVFQSAAQRLRRYWNLAADYYSKGDTPRAFCALGHAVHLVQDMHVPAHIHNDIHGPTVLLGKPDSFEKWTARTDWPSITRGRGESNASIWDSRPISPPGPDRTWNRDNITTKLAAFAGTLAYHTRQFRSVDAEGIGVVLAGQQQTGPLSDPECYEQGKLLIPAAIRNSARLIINFVDYVKRDGQSAS